MDGPVSVDKGNDLLVVSKERYCHRYRHAHVEDVSVIETSAASYYSEATVSDDDDGSYIGCVSLHSTPERTTNYPVVATLEDGIATTTISCDERRNNRTRFQRFVAAKQKMRAKRCHSEVSVSTNLPATVATSISVYPALESQNDATKELYSPPSLRRVYQCNSEEEVLQIFGASTPDFLDVSEETEVFAEAITEAESVAATTYSTFAATEEEPITTEGVDSCVATATSKAKEASHEPESPSLKTAQCNNMDESPTSVAKLPSMSLPPSDKNELPALTEDQVKKNLTWWDDDGNRTKRNTLKTDESIDCLSWDDDSTWDHIDNNIRCNWVKDLVGCDEEDDMPNKASSDHSVPFDENETIDSDNVNDDDSLCYHMPCDKMNGNVTVGSKRVQDLLCYCRKKLNDSVSHLADESNFSMDDISFDTMTEDERLSVLFTRDWFDLSFSCLPDEDDNVSQ